MKPVLALLALLLIGCSDTTGPAPDVEPVVSDFALELPQSIVVSFPEASSLELRHLVRWVRMSDGSTVHPDSFPVLTTAWAWFDLSDLSTGADLATGDGWTVAIPAWSEAGFVQDGTRYRAGLRVWIEDVGPKELSVFDFAPHDLYALR